MAVLGTVRAKVVGIESQMATEVTTAKQHLALTWQWRNNDGHARVPRRHPTTKQTRRP